MDRILMHQLKCLRQWRMASGSLRSQMMLSQPASLWLTASPVLRFPDWACLINKGKKKRKKKLGQRVYNYHQGKSWYVKYSCRNVFRTHQHLFLTIASHQVRYGGRHRSTHRASKMFSLCSASLRKTRSSECGSYWIMVSCCQSTWSTLIFVCPRPPCTKRKDWLRSLC